MALNSKLTHFLSLLLPALLLLGAFLPAVEAVNRGKGGHLPPAAFVPNAYQSASGRGSAQFGMHTTSPSSEFRQRRGELTQDGLWRREWRREVVRRAIMDALLEELGLD
ncbi:hypothetical protein DFP72DRAFT_900254 [Ephemerocybe angulata]|uniref:Uncharacterized protein n=1 Tax=Ephemerocybe angulata TaxID=980116 RepID=A0A8H6HWA7_9AGAR|nr:hypothetical protein DFP72DRAFT_900254 [Tulosesus angulatus]